MRGGIMKFKSIILFIILTVLGYTTSTFSREDVKSKAAFSLHIFSSNNLTGNLEPCGWGGKRSGGVARRAAYIKSNRKPDEHVLVLDGGDFIGRRGEKAKLEAKYTIKALMRMGYDAINIG